MKKKSLLLVFGIIFLISTSIAQTENNHSLFFDFSSPTIFSDYPNQSQIYNLGYEWRRKKESIGFGGGIAYGHPRFSIRSKIREQTISIISHGGSLNLFVDYFKSEKLSFGFFSAVGTYVTKIWFKVDGEDSSNWLESGTNYFGIGIKLDYHWKKINFRLKLPYEIYKDGQTPFQANPNLGLFVYNESYGVSPYLVKGFNPTIGIGYTFVKKQK